jgi:uncharacterized protein with von Willebrand factor type A (vWA) domain
VIREEDTHDELMRAFREYFKANQDWINKGTRRAGQNARFWLSEIRRIAKQRRFNIMEWRYDLNEKTQAKKAQKQSGSQDDSAN